MAMYVIFIIFCFLIFFAQECHTVSLSDVSDEVVKLTAMYNGKTSVIPLQDQSNTMNVSIGIQLLTFNGFDDVGGILDISTYLSIEWMEERYSNNSRPDALITVSAASVWKPPLILVNAAGTSTDIVQEQSLVNINLTSGKCIWAENVKLQGTCRPYVFYYPADSDECSFKFTSKAYNSDRLNLLTSYFVKNLTDHVAWTVQKMYTTKNVYNSKSYAEFQIRIQRRSTNIILVYILPTGILSVLNVFVFILPRRSRERAGYSVTCFLAFAVFMNTIVTTLPKSSDPVAALVYFLTGMMIINTIITITALLTLMIEKRVSDVKKVEENHEEENVSKNETSNQQSSLPNLKHFSICPEKNQENNEEGTSCQQSKPVKDVCQGQTQKNKEKEGITGCNCFLPNRVYDGSRNKQIHHEPPKCLSVFALKCRRFVRCLRLWFCCCRCCRCCILPNVDKVGWVEVGNTLDVFFFISFLVIEIIFTLSFLAHILSLYAAYKAQTLT